MHMTARYIIPFMLLIVTFLLHNCGNESSQKNQPASAVTSVSKQDTSTQKKPEPKESPVGKSVEELRQSQTNRIGTMPSGKDAELNHAAAAPPIQLPAEKKSQPAGPSGYISRNSVVLQTEPKNSAPQVRTFKIYEEVLILETKMTDETGNTAQYPKWYKVRCSDKKEGWVVARSVTVN